MSVKQQIHAAVDELPETLSLEEAIERLYRAFKLKQAAAGRQAGGDDELRAALQQGEADISAGRVKSHAEILSKYGHLLDGEP